MNQRLFNKAAQHLILGAIYLKNSNLSGEGSFFAEVDKNIQQQSFRGIRHCNLEELERNNKKLFLYKYIYSVGVRLINSDLQEEEQGFALTTIEADFEAHYLSDEELEEECIEAFGELNVGYHVWPYWREYIQSTCCRMGINSIVIPLYTDLQKVNGDSKKLNEHRSER